MDNTPKKRYSCTSEYATPKGSDDSDNESLYYSFIVSEDDGSLVNKENSLNCDQWTVNEQAKVNSPIAARVPKANTPLLRKVLQINSKKVSFNNIPKPNETCETMKKMDFKGGSGTSSSNLNSIEEFIIEQPFLLENSVEYVPINDLNITDDLENELHNTIIENPLTTKTVNLIPTVPVPQISGIKSIDQLSKVVETEHPSPKVNVTTKIKSIDEILYDGTKNAIQTKNVARLNRQILATESRKSILPVAKKSNRFSTYMPRKVDLRQSLGIAKHVTKSVTTANATTTTAAGTTKKSKIARNETVSWPKPTTGIKPPKPLIASTARQSLAVTTKKSTFIKPSSLPVQSNGNICQYCDKFFAKSHGMKTHLLEKCEKIPAPVRRQLMNISRETNSKQVSRTRSGIGQGIDSISKYSRFFQNLTNDGASGMQGDVVFENGLKNLRAELRKMKSAHTGITRTPSKPIRCHVCRKFFLDCVEYADHCTTCHNSF